MVDRVTHYMDETRQDSVTEPHSEKPVKPLVPRRARAPLAIATGVAQIIGTASGSPTAGELIDALATKQHLIDNSKGIVVSINTVTDTPTPEFSRNQEQQKPEPFVLQSFQLGKDVTAKLAELRKVSQDEINSAVSSAKSGDAADQLRQAILSDPEFKEARDTNAEIIKIAKAGYPGLPNAKTKNPKESEFEEHHVLAENRNKLLTSSFVLHNDGNGYDYAFFFDPIDVKVYPIAIEPIRKQGYELGMSVHTYSVKDQQGKDVEFKRIVPTVQNRQTKQILYLAVGPSGNFSAYPLAEGAGNSYVTPEPVRDLAKRADTGDTGGSDWEKAGVSREIYMNAMSEALNILHPDLRAGVESDDYKFNYVRNGFENSEGEVWRKGMSTDNDPKKGWLRETDRQSFTFTARDGKRTTITVVNEMDTKRGIGKRAYKNLQYTSAFEEGENKDGEGAIPFLEQFADSSFDGTVINIQWVSGNIPDYKSLNGGFVMGYLGSSGGYPLTAYAGYESGKNINIRAYNVGSVNAQIGDDADMFTRSVAQSLMLAVKRMYGDPQELLKNVQEGRNMAKAFGLLKEAGKKPPKFVKLSNIPPTKEGVKVSQTR